MVQPSKGQAILKLTLSNLRRGESLTNFVHSKSTDTHRRAFVYTPPGYDEQTDKRYPALYLQHGYGENEYGWRLENPDFNLTIDTVSRGDESKEYFLWHMRILPRLSTPARFEMGSGMLISAVLPEEAADYLRGVDL